MVNSDGETVTRSATALGVREAVAVLRLSELFRPFFFLFPPVLQAASATTNARISTH
ncbi:hypothetical protein [Kitasatospora sp. Root107]|uniref:hypothetical protein n=1 Tax=Kitasatospora sp. Root107 TaxID=1736424 RepID=UPI0012FBA77B|nr:hypothetical protein [Kitasatospora sp. Root107]